MQSLIRSQLRAAVSVTVTLLLMVVTLPAIFWTFPGLTETRLLGVPLSWLILAIGAYVVVLTLGWLYVRHAERAERLFTDLVEPRPRDSA